MKVIPEVRHVHYICYLRFLFQYQIFVIPYKLHITQHDKAENIKLCNVLPY